MEFLEQLFFHQMLWMTEELEGSNTCFYNNNKNIQTIGE